MMPALSELHLLQWRLPWGALVLLLPLLQGWLAKRRQQQLARYAEPHLLPWAVWRRGQGRASRARRLAEALAWVLLATAAAGPRLPQAAPEPAADNAGQRHVIDVMVALDVSASMAARDVAPDRLTRARLELTDLLQRLHGERLGLMLYAGQAGVLLPPTDDPALFARALSQAGADLLDAPGTELARALTLARQSLGPRPGETAGSRAVLLVTDAEEDSLQGAAGERVRQAVQALRTEGLSLFVLVLASAQGAPFALPDGVRAMQNGTPVISRPALAAYRRLAQSTGGDLALVSDGPADWDVLYDGGLAKLPGAALTNGPVRAWRELFMWPLGLALFLLLWCLLPPGQRRAPPPVGLLALLIAGAVVSPSVDAADASDSNSARVVQAAAQAYRAGRWSQALPLFERQGGHAGHMGAGAAAWKLHDHATAARHFSQALLLARTDGERDDALYNLGNAHYAQGRWRGAAQAWRTVLLSRPGDARAAANLVHAEAQLARRSGGAPMQSDLRGRRGFTAEGRVGGDGADGVQDEALYLQGLPQAPGSAGAVDARLKTDAHGVQARMAPPDPQQLQSGLVKLERMEERQREGLRGLLKQDRTPVTADNTGVPW